jgi:hypothetical protein
MATTVIVSFEDHAPCATVDGQTYTNPLYTEADAKIAAAYRAMANDPEWIAFNRQMRKRGRRDVSDE